MTLGDDGPELQHTKSCLRSTNVDHVINKNVMVEYGAHCTRLAPVAENRTQCVVHTVGTSGWVQKTGHTSHHTSSIQSHGAKNGAHYTTHSWHQWQGGGNRADFATHI